MNKRFVYYNHINLKYENVEAMGTSQKCIIYYYVYKNVDSLISIVNRTKNVMKNSIL